MSGLVKLRALTKVWACKDKGSNQSWELFADFFSPKAAVYSLSWVVLGLGWLPRGLLSSLFSREGLVVGVLRVFYECVNYPP